MLYNLEILLNTGFDFMGQNSSFACVTSSQVTLELLVPGIHFEQYRCMIDIREYYFIE
jgi:hypothetical protein